MSITVRNAGGVPFLVLQGFFIVRPGQMPDGDTVAFAAGKPYTPKQVKTNVPLDANAQKSSNIRLQSIDAPEKAQPLGAKSRDKLLTALGFSPKDLGLTDTDFTAGGVATKVPGWLLTHGMDGNRRPLGYVMTEDPKIVHGTEVPAHAVQPLLRRTANFRQVSSGAAFPAFYENTDEAHAVEFQVASRMARKLRKGVWAKDATTTGFVATPPSLAKDGALVYPKFFRRVQDWKAAKPSATAFIQWLKTQPDGKKMVIGAERYPLPLWKLFVKVSATQVAVPYDVSKLWWSE